MQTFVCEQCGGTAYEQITQTQVECLQCGHRSLYSSGPKVEEFVLAEEEPLLDLQKKESYVIASLGKRFLNYFIDVFFVCFVYVLVQSLAGGISYPGLMPEDATIIGILLIMPFYYVLMEYQFGKTLGKFITRTRVISQNGSRMSFGQCVLRTLCRIIPLERFSGLFSGGVFWHDSIPKTLVVED